MAHENSVILRSEQVEPVGAILRQGLEVTVTDNREALVPFRELGRPRLLVLRPFGIAHTAQPDRTPVVIEGEAILCDVRVRHYNVALVLVGTVGVPVVVGNKLSRAIVVAIRRGHDCPDVLSEFDARLRIIELVADIHPLLLNRHPHVHVGVP